ncbi:ComF family protein [Hyphococcus sp.]|uniref:ComF family protein n=1 Tax=Hyphococcus sp. TaxID=2038636 RepID=UPI0035C6889A
MKPQILTRLGAWSKGAAQKALDLAMPPHCPVTREEIASSEALAPRAWAAAHFIEAPYCTRCGVPFAADYGEEIECPACIAEPPDFAHARAALVYDDASHGLIVGFKHGDRTELAAMFGRWMARAGEDLATGSSILVPVPLHARRLRERRFNQSALLAQALARETGAGLCLDGLLRRRATPPQKDLSAEGRKRNVSGAFGVRDDKARLRFRDAHVVLVDDVLTTGATLSAAARALKRAGASQVDALVLARVVKGGIGAI